MFAPLVESQIPASKRMCAPLVKSQIPAWEQGAGVRLVPECGPPAPCSHRYFSNRLSQGYTGGFSDFISHIITYILEISTFYINNIIYITDLFNKYEIYIGRHADTSFKF